MAAHGCLDDIIDAVQTANMVLVAVGKEDGRDFGTSQVLVVIQDTPRPLTLLVASVDEQHLFMRITHEVVIAPTGVVDRIIVDMHDINMGRDLHWAPRKFSVIEQGYGGLISIVVEVFSRGKCSL